MAAPRQGMQRLPSTRKGGKTAPAFPTKVRSTLSYVPYIALGCYAGMMVGTGLWASYTDRTVNAIDELLTILNADIDGGSTPASEVTGEAHIIGTAASFTVVGLGVLGLVLWRKKLEADQDVMGEVPLQAFWWIWACAAAQVAWWIMMIWVAFVILGDGVLASLVFSIDRQLEGAVRNTEECSRPGADPPCPPYPDVIKHYNCPGNCFTITTTGFLVDHTPDNPSTSCICDMDQIQDARGACNKAMAAIGGVFAGIWIMFLAGTGLHHSLTVYYGKAKKEEQIDDILTDLQ